MKLLRRAEFLKLPEGTFYAKGKPWYFSGLRVKYDTTFNKGMPSDWWCLDPCWIDTDNLYEAVDALEAMRDKGESRPMETSIGRDGLHEDDALFLVFEPDDLLALRRMLDKALSAGPL